MHFTKPSALYDPLRYACFPTNASSFCLLKNWLWLGFLYSTKRRNESTKQNHETKWWNHWTIIRGLCGGHCTNFYIPKSWQRVGHRMVPGYHICSLLLFSRLKPRQYTRSKNTYSSVGNYIYRDLSLKTSNWNYKLNLTQYMISLRVCTLLYRDINICILLYCVYFYAEHGIDLESFYLLEVKDLQDIFPTTMFDTMLKTRRVLRQVKACVTKIMQIFWAYSIFTILMCQYSVKISHSR